MRSGSREWRRCSYPIRGSLRIRITPTPYKLTASASFAGSTQAYSAARKHISMR
jgi:hypothetical protein